MFIRGITVGIAHTISEGNFIDIDAHQVRTPRDWRTYGEQIERALHQNGELEIYISSTAAVRSVSIAIGPVEIIEPTGEPGHNWNGFAFVVGLSTLRQLSAALEVAIASVE